MTDDPTQDQPQQDDATTAGPVPSPADGGGVDTPTPAGPPTGASAPGDSPQDGAGAAAPAPAPADPPASAASPTPAPAAPSAPSPSPAPAPVAESGPAPTPAPSPGPGGARPAPPRPGAVPSPAALARAPRPPRAAAPAAAPGATAPAAAPAPAPTPVSTEELVARAREWGRVGEDGTVYVRTPDGERAVGSYPGATDDEALAYFARKYDDLAAQLDLAEQRLSTPDAPVKEVARALEALRPQLHDAPVVGDVAALEARLAAVDVVLAMRRRQAEEQRAAAKETARLERAALVEEAERIAATDPARMQWKPSGDRLRALFDLWKAAQRTGQRLDKPVEDELWKRFSHARTAFDRARRHHFAELEKRHAEVKALKSAIVAEAQALATSTDWGPTSGAFRGLMDRWKAAGRASRKDDDALWAQFRAAQDQFFTARKADQAQQDDEFRGNLVVKEELLVEAEALLPVEDLDAAKRALRDIQDRWESAGKVPRADLGRVERRLRAVAEAVRAAEEEQWRRTNPEARARAEGALGQLEQVIANLEADLAAARDEGDTRRVAEAEEALSARRAWLTQVQRAADDFSA